LGVVALAALMSVGAAACGAPDTGAGTPNMSNDTSVADRGASNGAVSAGAAELPRVVMFGTSLTAGLGIDPDSAWPAVVQRMADSAGVRVRIDNAGLSGETSAGALRRVEWVLRDPVQLVVLEVGANDGLRGVNPDTTRETLVAVIERVQALQPNARVLLVAMEAPPNLGAEYTASFRRAYTEAARRTGVPLLPFLLEGVAGERALNQADGIHPNEEGARRVARNLWTGLEAELRGVEQGRGPG
jgi:acyl-CoA thioesterase-1